MKIKVTFILLLVLTGVFAAIFCLQASRYETLGGDLPKAIKEKDTPQLIKELISGMKESLEKDEDSFTALISKVETYIPQVDDSASRSVLHSMLAEMYNHYYLRNRWSIDQRTNLKDYVPQDMKEWSSNLFSDKIKLELDESLCPALLLRATPVSKFKAILEEGKDSSVLRPTLYDFLAYRYVSIVPSDSVYKELVAFRNSQADKRAAILAELDYLDYKLGQDGLPESYMASLDSLMAIYGEKDFSVEITDRKVNAILTNFRDGNANEDSIKGVAYSLLKEAIDRFPHYDRIGLLKRRIAVMELPNLSVTMDKNVYPGKDIKIKISYTNIRNIRIGIYKSLKLARNNYTLPEKDQYKLGESLKKVSFALPYTNSYTRQDTTLTIPIGTLGLYQCVITADVKNIRTDNLFSVSRIASVSRASDKSTEILVTDYEDGRPLPDLTVTYFRRQGRTYKELGKVKTDKFGLVELPEDNKINAYQVSGGGDTHSLLTSIYQGMGRWRETKERPMLSLFTDRAIYRPGQTVFFKGIAYSLDKERAETIKNADYTVIMRDANHKEVMKKSFKTNDFGSFNGEFVIPSGALNGTFTLTSEGNASVSVRVEEYKRPSFLAEMLPVKDEVSFGELLVLKGFAKTFSGVPLESGTVSYRIVRRPMWWWRMSQERQVAEGRTIVGKDGSFLFSFKPMKEERGPKSNNFEIIAVITDSKGESQEIRSNFSVGEVSVLLASDIKELLEKDTAGLTISARTLNGETVKLLGTYYVSPLTDTGEGKDPKEGAPVMNGSFTTGESLPGGVFSHLPSGRYRIYFEVKDSRGREVKESHSFILYSPKDKRPPVFTDTWLTNNKETCLVGEETAFTFGTSHKDAHVLYEIFVDGNCVQRKQMVLSNENAIINIPFLETYGNGFIAQFSFIKKGNLYVTQVPVKRQLPNKKLTIKPIVFRDRTLPGAKENWKFRITDADSLVVSAEVLASLYDASLDKIVPFNWLFSPERQISLFVPSFNISEGLGLSNDYSSNNSKALDVPEFSYDYLDWQGVLEMRRSRSAGDAIVVGYGRSMAVNATMGVEETGVQLLSKQSPAYANVVLEENAVMDAASVGDAAPPKQTSPIPQWRQNFNETAFFYPYLQTDKDGSLMISFSMPESNTTWKLQALAHTMDMKYGMVTKEIITSKPIMISPNLPRFMRRGDRVSFSSQVMNQSKETVAGNVRLELFDPATDQLLSSGSIQPRPFQLKAGETSVVSWEVSVPETIQLVGCRIIADSDAGSDGEQHLIPILTDKVLITESVPFFMTGTGSKRLRLPAFKNGTSVSMALEITANPVWYAVQSLPTITIPQTDNVISLFASYYSNVLATHIAHSNPRIENIVKQWTAQGGNASTLISNLDKNEDLKNILLQETPWVMEAATDTERKQRLSLLFDLNRSGDQKESAMRRLIENQGYEGGWAWFKGMPSNRGMTLFVLEGMARLTQLNAIEYNQKEKEMQIKALKYLDEGIAEDYKHAKGKDGKIENATLSSGQLEYLYVRSSYRSIPEGEGAREASRFYTKLAEETWGKRTIEEKARIAILMFRNGKKEVADRIVAWLRKTATTSDELGMYWANNKGTAGYLTSPVDVHCLLMSLFSEVSPDKKEADLMKQWLLNQKRTQDWASVPATVNAIYALLLTGSDWLTETSNCTVRWGDKRIDTDNGETATGYVKEVVKGKEITSGMRTAEIKKEGNVPAWGALYGQYLVPASQVDKGKGVLNVDRKLFIESNNGQNREIQLITDRHVAKVGDRLIVRLTIRTDRDMSYVYLKDLRAGCLEPVGQLSGSQFREGVWYYQSPKDISQEFFFDRLPKGTFVLEYPVSVTRSGEYSAGVSTIQCLYAPEFVSHSAGESITVE